MDRPDQNTLEQWASKLAALSLILRGYGPIYITDSERSDASSTSLMVAHYLSDQVNLNMELK